MNRKASARASSIVAITSCCKNGISHAKENTQGSHENLSIPDGPSPRQRDNGALLRRITDASWSEISAIAYSSHLGLIATGSTDGSIQVSKVYRSAHDRQLWCSTYLGRTSRDTLQWNGIAGMVTANCQSRIQQHTARDLALRHQRRLSDASLHFSTFGINLSELMLPEKRRGNSREQ